MAVKKAYEIGRNLWKRWILNISLKSIFFFGKCWIFQTLRDRFCDASSRWVWFSIGSSRTSITSASVIWEMLSEKSLAITFESSCCIGPSSRPVISSSVLMIISMEPSSLANWQWFESQAGVEDPSLQKFWTESWDELWDQFFIHVSLKFSLLIRG